MSRHSVSIVLLDDVVPSDFASPMDVFGGAKTIDGKPCYEIKLCGISKSVQTKHFTINTGYSLRSLDSADTILVPGTHNPAKPIPAALRRALQRAYKNGVRIVSICTGAFVLAAAGLLDGKRATTHWLAASTIATLYPRVEVDPNVLFVDNGQVLSSAGATSGVDLCLYLISLDFGPAVAAQCARKAVVPLLRTGGQAQFIEPGPLPTVEGTLDPLFVWIENNLSKKLDVAQLADQAAPSTSFGCFVMDAWVALWFFAGAPSVYRFIRRSDEVTSQNS